MRERLIELLEEAKAQALNTVGSLNEGWGAWYADYLLKNGVVLFPCKIGDTIFILSQYISRGDEYHLIECKVEQITYTEGRAYCVVSNSRGTLFEAEEGEFGYTAFCIKEEAEKALKERENGNTM